MSTLTIDLGPVIQLTDEKFERLAITNPDLQLEKTVNGELVIMSPTGGDTGRRNLEIEGQLWYWNRNAKMGVAFNSSTGFKLPNGATRSPDAAWIAKQRYEQLTTEQKTKFLPLCPDFVVELCSPTDDFEQLRQKMQEYVENGIILGWLISPKLQKVEIYRQGKSPEVLKSARSLSGETVLPGFVLDLDSIFNAV